MGEDFTYRATGKYFNEDASENGNDAWYLGRGALRTDWKAGESDSVMTTANFYNGEEDIFSPRALRQAPFVSRANIDQTLSGGHALVRWNHLFSETSDGTLQTYFDQYRREEDFFGENRYTWDIEWDHRFMWGERQELVYGLGYRLQADDTDGSFAASFEPGNRTTNLLQAFLQDTVALVPESLWLTLGIKAERNDFSGLEFQPTARLAWHPHEKHTVWTSFSRAVRIPSRVDHDLQLSSWIVQGSSLFRAYGDSTREAETVLAYEAGYRVQPHRRVSVDVAAFYNDYDNLTTLTARSPFTENGYTVLPRYIDDQGKAETYGAELAVSTELMRHWRVETAYTFLEMQVHPGSDA